MRQMVEDNPEIGHILNDPSMLQQSLETARNPNMMREMMRESPPPHHHHPHPTVPPTLTPHLSIRLFYSLVAT